MLVFWGIYSCQLLAAAGKWLGHLWFLQRTLSGNLLAICLFLLPNPLHRSSAYCHLLQMRSLEVDFSTQSREHGLQIG